jgi:hypothetical protein
MARKHNGFIAEAAGSALLLAALFAVSADAQVNKNARKPRPTPTPVSTEPAVISRAGDYPVVTLEPMQAPEEGEAVKTDTSNSQTIEELRERLLLLESNSKKKDPDEKQKRIALNLDILTKSEQRAEGLRKQLFDMIEKESTLRTRIDQLDNEMRPEALERAFATVGSLRPEELRAQKRRSLEIEKRNQETLLVEVQKNRTNIEQSLQRADALVEKLRVRIEKEIDDALGSDDGPSNPTSDNP